jgi:hypothetical protein
MATPTFSINGGSNLAGIRASWQQVVKRRQSDGKIIYQNYALHTWDIEQMEMSAYLSLVAQAGKRLTSLATTNIDDINNGATYSSAEILGVVGGEQVGQRMTGIRVEFRVDVS